MTKRALFLGRFQPVHNGHIDAIRQILEHRDEFDEVLIGIGSAENDFLPENPLTAGERFELLGMALREEGLPREKFWIFPVRNIERYSLWPHHVAKLCPSFDAVFSGSPLVRMLFEEAFPDGKDIYEITKRVTVSGTEIREKILQGSSSLQGLVPRYVEQFLAERRISERLRRMTT